MVRYTAYRRIYEKFSFLTRPRGQNGRILRPSRAMSGSAGLSPLRNRKPEGSTLNVYARNLKKECAGLVAGQAVLTAEIKRRTCIRHRPLPTPTERLLSSIPKSRASAHQAGVRERHARAHFACGQTLADCCKVCTIKLSHFRGSLHSTRF